MAVPQPTSKIKGETGGQFDKQRAALPIKPVGNGSCQLVRTPKKAKGKLRERLGVECRGKCPGGGTCRTSIIIIDTSYTSECKCD